MTREPRLTPERRYKVRQLLLITLSVCQTDKQVKDYINLVYRDFPFHREYAYALLYALDTGEPLDLHAGRER